MSAPPTTDGVHPDAQSLLDARLRALIDALEDAAEEHGRTLAALGAVGEVELVFSKHGYQHMRLNLFLRPSLRVRRRRAERSP